MFYLIPLSLSLAVPEAIPFHPKNERLPNRFPAAIIKSRQHFSLHLLQEVQCFPQGQFSGSTMICYILEVSMVGTLVCPGTHPKHQDATEKWIPAIKHGGPLGNHELNGGLVILVRWEHINNAGSFQQTMFRYRRPWPYFSSPRFLFEIRQGILTLLLGV